MLLNVRLVQQAKHHSANMFCLRKQKTECSEWNEACACVSRTSCDARTIRPTTTWCVRLFSSWTSCVEAPLEVLACWASTSMNQMSTWSSRPWRRWQSTARAPARRTRSVTEKSRREEHWGTEFRWILCTYILCVLQTCIVTHESNGIDIITALILNDISPLCRYRMEMVLQLKVR